MRPRFLLPWLVAAGLTAGVAQAADTKHWMPVRTPEPATLDIVLHRPDGVDAPRPAVVLAHGCAGVVGAQRTWAKTLVGWGYVALTVDSFGGRGVKEMCTGGKGPSALQRVDDVAAGVRWLKAQPFVKGDRIALIGNSMGGATTLFAMLRRTSGATWTAPETGIAAAVAFYPDCSIRGSDNAGYRYEALAPLRILVGDQDDWTPAPACEALVPRVGGAHTSIRVFPGAVHGFDSVGSRLRYREDVRNRNKPGGCCGAWIGYHEPSFLAAKEDVRMFLLEHIGPPQ